MSQVFFEMDSYMMSENHLGPTDLVKYSLNNVNWTRIMSHVFMYENTLKVNGKMTNGNNDVTQKHKTHNFI